jgi:transcriptional regulator with XRE-family HTH domain
MTPKTRGTASLVSMTADVPRRALSQVQGKLATGRAPSGRTGITAVKEGRTAMLLRHQLGDVLRDARLEQGRTLREVSKQARVSLGYLSEIERGQKEASSELLASICGALDVPLSLVLHSVSRRIADVEGVTTCLTVDDSIALANSMAMSESMALADSTALAARLDGDPSLRVDEVQVPDTVPDELTNEVASARAGQHKGGLVSAA